MSPTKPQAAAKPQVCTAYDRRSDHHSRRSPGRRHTLGRAWRPPKRRGGGVEHRGVGETDARSEDDRAGESDREGPSGNGEQRDTHHGRHVADPHHSLRPRESFRHRESAERARDHRDEEEGRAKDPRQRER